jgi:hypothetical protein
MFFNVLFNISVFTCVVSMSIVVWLHVLDDQRKWVRMIYDVARYVCSISGILIIISAFASIYTDNPVFSSPRPRLPFDGPY